MERGAIAVRMLGYMYTCITILIASHMTLRGSVNKNIYWNSHFGFPILSKDSLYRRFSINENLVNEASTSHLFSTTSHHECQLTESLLYYEWDICLKICYLNLEIIQNKSVQRMAIFSLYLPKSFGPPVLNYKKCSYFAKLGSIFFSN